MLKYYLLLLLFPITAYCNESWIPFSSFETTLLSEPVSLKSLNNEWKNGNFREGEQQYGDVWIESGMKKGQWGVSALYRQRKQLDFSKDTAELYNIIENTHDLALGKTYQVDLSTQQFSTLGVRGTYSLRPHSRVSLELGASVFKASQLMSGSMLGTARSLSNHDYDYNVDVNYLYDKDVLFDRPNVNKPSGKGYSIGLAGHWQVTSRINASIKVKDALAAIYWKDIPYTEANVTSSTKVVGSDGFIKVRADLQGQESYRKKFKQSIAASGNTQLSYKTSDSQVLLVDIKYFGDNAYMGIGGERKFNNSNFSTLYYPDLKTLSLSYQHKKMTFKFATDNLNLGKANTLWLGVGYN